MPDLRLFWDALLAAAPRPAEHAPVVGCSFIHFSKHNSPDFYGDEGPIVADDWLTSHKDLDETLHCTDAQKVDYSNLKLRGEAKNWWKSRKIHLTTEMGKVVLFPRSASKESLTIISSHVHRGSSGIVFERFKAQMVIVVV
jgi:hypothetical protein